VCESVTMNGSHFSFFVAEVDEASGR
jgi:hypothetical protein